MKCLIVDTVPLGPGGITTVIMNYYSVMIRSGLDVDIVVVDKELQEKHSRVFNENGTHVYYFTRKTNRKKYFWDIFCLCRKEHYDVIHVHGNSGTMLIDLLPAHLAGVDKRIAHCHNVEHGHRILNKIINPIFRTQVTMALACSDEAGEWLFGREKYTVLNNAIAVTDFKYNPQVRKRIRQELGYGIKDTVLVHAGYFNAQKNQSFLIELMKRNRDKNLKLLFIGDGRMRKSIEDSTTDDRIYFLGTTDAVEDYLQAADCFVFPSKWEGLGIAALEAQASGLPCIVSAYVPKLVNMSGKVQFYDLNDTLSWDDAVKRIKPESDYQRESCSEANIEKMTLKGYNIRNEGQRLVQIYTNL